MSMSIPNGGADRLAAADSSAKLASSSAASPKDQGGSASDTSEITNISDLRKAELRGANVTVSDEAVVKEVEKAIRAVQGRTTTLEFSVHHKTNLVAVKVLDKDSGEVIREIPPEKTLDFVAKLWEMAGVLVDERR